MPRRQVEQSDYFPYHICARTNNRDWFNLPLDIVYDIFAIKLDKTIKLYAVECHAFVLMANHFHMLASTPRANLSEAMRYLMTETSRSIARASNRINRIYGSRYHWTIIRGNDHYAHAYWYVYRNPIKAKIVTKAEDYLWSTLHNKHCLLKTLVKPRTDEFSDYIPPDKSHLLSWLNQAGDQNYIESVRKALWKHEFSFGQNKLSGKRFRFHDKLHPKNTPGT